MPLGLWDATRRRDPPKKPGSYRVRFEAKDGLKVVAQKTFRIVVLP